MFVFSILILISSAAFAQHYYVDPCGNDSAAGTSWATAFQTIQKGIDDANNGDVVEVNEGTYYENLQLNGVNNIILTSTDPTDWNVVKNTVIDANYNGNVMELSDCNPIIKGFQIQNGELGIACNDSSCTIERCNIIANICWGIGCSGNGTGRPIINGNIIAGNENGIVCLSGAAPLIENNIIFDIANNGIINAPDAGATIIKNNNILRCGVSGVTKISSTSPIINNCIIWDCNDDLIDCNATYSCIQNNDLGIGNIHSDPCFVDADANNFHLRAGSLCIDAGDPNFNDANQTDIDGQPRIINGRVDMGADEANEVANLTIFRIRNDLDDDVVRVDNHGNMALMGMLTESTFPISTPAKEFRFKDVDGNDAAIINAHNGNLFIKGALYQNQTTLTPSGDNNFIIKNSTGIVVAYINNTGNLYLKGSLYERALTRKILALKSSNNSITANFDNAGNLHLKGILESNSTPSASLEKELRIKTAGSDVAIIGTESGNMFIQGFLYQNQTILEPSSGNNFIIKDEEGEIVSYINMYGDLYLKGTLREQE
jgi:hypothetical protein